MAPHLRGSPQFNERSLAVGTSFLLAEINRLNERNWNYGDPSVIISSNLRLKNDGTPYSAQNEPSDSGVAVYFTLIIRRNGRVIERPIARACDKWRKTADNLYAIGLDISLDRAKFRYGASNMEQAFRGYLAIPEKCGGQSWWDKLKVQPTATQEQIKMAYRELAKTEHPDKGGNQDRWNLVAEAYEEAMGQFR